MFRVSVDSWHNHRSTKVFLTVVAAILWDLPMEEAGNFHLYFEGVGTSKSRISTPRMIAICFKRLSEG